jgi:DNA-binding NtrC family response regulator
MDMALPEGIQGRELAERLLAEHPGLPVIYTSGHAAEHAAQGLTLVPGQNFLSKPFDIAALGALVRRRLDEAHA